MRFSLPRPHRLARAYYFPRAFGFGATFIAAWLMAWEGDLAWSVIPFAAIQFLVYPHLVYLRACFAKDSKRAELQNLLLDALLLGAWAAEFYFKWWLLYALMASVCLNNAANGGVKDALKAFLLFSVGGLIWGAVKDFQYQPETSLSVTLVCIVGLSLYTINVAQLFYRQNKQLMSSKQEIEEKNFVFQSLLALSMVTHQAEDVEKLFENSLPHLKHMFPQAGFGVLIRDLNRPRSVRNLSFIDIAPSEQEWLLEQIRRVEQLPRLLELKNPISGNSFCVLPMKGHLKQSDGIFIIRHDKFDDMIRSTITLFLEQLAAALENQLLTAQLRKMASTDPLTGTFNRAYFDKEWQLALRNKREHQRIDFAVMMVDINGLKELNDEYGHEVGDRLIQTVAVLLQETCRVNDLVVRFGGDEFLILCPSTTYEDATYLLKRIRHAEQRCYLPCGRGEKGLIQMPVRISIGLASSSECEPESVLKLADDRMYQNKREFYQIHPQIDRK